MTTQPVKPKSAHRDLLQLSRGDFLETLSEGLPLIIDNALSLWGEANEVARLGKRRAAGILQAIAEEEGAKALLLFDAVRCPMSRKEESDRLIRYFNDHLAKGIYIKYYRTRLAGFAEIQEMVNRERESFYREGEYGEFICGNSIVEDRESRLYVDYIQRADRSYSWQAPATTHLYMGYAGYSGVLRVVEALSHLQAFTQQGLAICGGFWGSISLGNEEADQQRTGNRTQEWGRKRLRLLNSQMIEQFERAGISFAEEDRPSMTAVVDGLMYPLYPFDLMREDNFSTLPPADDPVW